jgi:DNA-binding response OmpR family regulator
MVAETPVAVRGRVFVADDDDDLRALVASTLRSDGYVVVEARDGAELLTLLVESLDDPATRPDLILSDARMPKLSGLGVLEHLTRAQVKIPVLIMTGFVPLSVGVVARRLGGLGVLSKPFDMSTLRAAVANAERGGAAWPPVGAH